MQAETPAALAGLRVLEFSVAGAASWLGRHLAYYGAEVVKVESAARPDVVRMYVSPREPERGVQPDLSPWLAEWHTGKRHLGVNLKHPEAATLIHRLVPHFDVVSENFSPGVTERLGIHYEALRQHRPDLIMASLSGFGQNGPHRHYISWGPNLEAISGWSQLGGFAGDPPLHSPLAIPDWLGGMHGLLAVMAALEHRAKTGEGQYIDLSQFESAVSVLGDLLLPVTANGSPPERLGYRHPLCAPQGCYACAGEDRWVALTVRDDAQWQRLCGLLGRADWAADVGLETAEGRRRAAEALDQGIAAWTRPRAAPDVVERLQAVGIAAGLVQVAPDLETDPHLQARGHFQPAPHLRVGEVLTTGLTGHMNRTPGRNGRAGALVGQDSVAVLQALLGLSAAQCDDLIERGLVEVPAAVPQRPD